MLKNSHLLKSDGELTVKSRAFLISGIIFYTILFFLKCQKKEWRRLEFSTLVVS